MFKEAVYLSFQFSGSCFSVLMSQISQSVPIKSLESSTLNQRRERQRFQSYHNLHGLLGLRSSTTLSQEHAQQGENGREANKILARHSAAAAKANQRG